MSKVLIVDDEEDIVRLLKTVLIKEGIENVYTASTAAEGFGQFQDKHPDVVILDIMLPDGEGYDVCKKIRSISHVPILFLSAKTEEVDKLVGLAIGGDDYIGKPFSPKEVAYRVKAQLRRAEYQQVQVKADPIIQVGPFVFDEEKVELRKHGTIIELKPKELGLFTHLLKHPNQIISKEKLYYQVWGEDFFGFDNTVMVHIRKLREKIEDDPSNPTYLLTVKGLGYKLVVKDE
ncbi:two-component response regulator [Brevibacillus brevis NBRC 100599]|uniref:Two-component response regulator n=1 Tax=Brevibacillus brevis (strain 47 / JCM 6285 / NBRC 100599) TaxID=358681 RepID=C0Z8U7_BREBN|nr:response regulator transcription factor [Brevibacillus brevis]BAH42417.1 two-component response regulator [Brevibacillus brevis NBRC 100599]